MKVTKFLIILLFVLFVCFGSSQAKEVMINGTKIETDQGVIIIILGEDNDEMESKEESVIYQEEEKISSEKILDLGPYNLGEIKLEPLPEEMKYRTGVVHNRTKYVQAFFVEDYVVKLKPGEQRVIRLRDLGEYYMKSILYNRQHRAIMQFESMMDINRQIIRSGKYRGFGWAFYPAIEHFKRIR